MQTQYGKAVVVESVFKKKQILNSTVAVNEWISVAGELVIISYKILKLFIDCIYV